MESCWKKSPTDRPSFLDVCTALEEIPIQQPPDKIDYQTSAQVHQEKGYYKLSPLLAGYVRSPSAPVTPASSAAPSQVQTPTTSDTSQTSTSNDRDPPAQPPYVHYSHPDNSESHRSLIAH